jgi:aspartate ammonia-lyase
MTTTTSSYRIERDPLGEKHVPADALFGVQTLRAKETFRSASCECILN